MWEEGGDTLLYLVIQEPGWWNLLSSIHGSRKGTELAVEA